MLVHLIPEVGFGWAIRVCAFTILTLLTFANLVMRSRLTPTKRPLSFLAFVRPLKEPTFSLLTAAIFFYYCQLYDFARLLTDVNCRRGNVHTSHLSSRRSAIARHVF